MTHPLVVGLFESADKAITAARALRTILNANATKLRKRAVLEIVE